MIKYVCLFDIDGTLISSGGAGKAALERALTVLHGVEEIMPHLRLSGRTDRAIAKDLLEMAGLPSTDDDVRTLQQGYLKHLPDSLANSVGKVLPGIAGLLEILHSRDDVLIGLLTGNIRAGAKIKLGHFGLFDYFSFGGFGDLHFDRDDVAREAWEQIEEQLGESADPENVWVLGDTPLDVQCARAIGAKAVALATGWHTLDQLRESEPDLLLKDLSDHQPLLSHWE